MNKTPKRFEIDMQRAQAVSVLSSMLPKLINSNQKIAMKLAKNNSTISMTRRENHYGIGQDSNPRLLIIDLPHKQSLLNHHLNSSLGFKNKT